MMRLHLDPKTKNLSIFVSKYVLGIVLLIYAYIKIIGESNPVKLIGHFVIIVLVWRILLWFYRRSILNSKRVSSYGKWAIIVDNGDVNCTLTSTFIDYLAKHNVSLYIISSNQMKLDSVKTCLETNYDYHFNNMKFKLYNFNNNSCSLTSYPSSNTDSHLEFYKELESECQQIDLINRYDDDDNGNDSKSSIGLFINSCFYSKDNKDDFKKYDDYDDEEVDNVMSRYIIPIVRLSAIVLKSMKLRKNGAIVHISSAMGNYASPFLAVPSAISAFMTQFSRSMHVECWGSGVDFLAVTPFDMRRPSTSSSRISPSSTSDPGNYDKNKVTANTKDEPDITDDLIKINNHNNHHNTDHYHRALVHSIMNQLGKRYVWQIGGTWFDELYNLLFTYDPTGYCLEYWYKYLESKYYAAH